MKSTGFFSSTRLLLGAGALALLALAPSRLAAVVLDNSYLLGTVVPGAPADYSSETGYVNGLVTVYNGGVAPSDGHTYTIIGPGANVPAAPISGIPLSDNPGFDTVATNSATNISTQGTAWLVAKFGNHDAVYYVGGISTFSLPSKSDLWDTGNGLSGYSLHGTAPSNTPGVPDGGTTGVLLGLALLGIGAVSRRLGRKNA